MSRRRFRSRVYLDLDPAFTQLWQSVEGVDMGLDGHTHFVTVGLQIGGDSSIPDCGRRWIPSLTPVVLEHSARADEITSTTWSLPVANWRGYGSVRHADVLYGQKAHSLRALIDLPCRTDETLLLALDIHPDERIDLDVGGRCMAGCVSTRVSPPARLRAIAISFGDPRPSSVWPRVAMSSLGAGGSAIAARVTSHPEDR